MSHLPEYVDKNLPMTLNDEVLAIIENNEVKSKTLSDSMIFDLILARENYIREKMYQDDFKDHPMNTNPNYNLIKIDQAFWENLTIEQPQGYDLLFTQGPMLEKASWDQIQDSLQKLKKNIKPNICIAGGALFSILFGLEINDIDLFIYQLDKTAATDLIQDFLKKKLLLYQQNDENFKKISITRTKNAVTLFTKTRKSSYDEEKDSFSSKVINKEYQIILRLYRSLSEVLHGFDVDCCSIGFDGQDLWMTQRTYYALTRGYNTVNFDRLSPSYEYRLAKYGTRGARIKIPNFDINKIKQDVLDNDIESIQNVTHTIRRYRELINAKGLDILIGLNDRYLRSEKAKSVIKDLSAERSDYLSVPFKKYDGRSAGSELDSLFTYLIINENRQRYDEYKSYLQYYYLDDVNDPAYQQYRKYSEFLPFEEYADAPEILKVENPHFYQEAIKLSQILPHCQLFVNNLNKAKFFYFFRLEFVRLKDIIFDTAIDTVLNLPQFLYDGLAIIKPWDIPRQIDYKTINPGEQMTNTFNVTVLQNPSIWYEGRYYDNE